MNHRQLKVLILDQLMQTQASNFDKIDQVTVRCPFCGDSMKDLNHSHFSVKLNLKSDEPILFHCLRCDIGGILTPSILREFNVNNLQLNSGLLIYNKKAVNSIRKKLGIINNNLDFIVPTPRITDNTIMKKEYIENRLGLSFSIDELVKLKVVFSLGEFLKINDIISLTCNKEKAQMLHDDYVGFLTSKNEFINFRDVTGKNKRYNVYNIYKNLDNTRKFYTIPNEIDLLTTDTIEINIAEGVFDILGIFYHIKEGITKNNLYTAVCGAGYISVLKYWIQTGVFDNVIINIYSDSDRYPSFYKNIKHDLDDWIYDVKLYYNTLGKDYGVKKHQIEIKRKKIMI